MKKILLLSISTFLVGAMNAQTVVFSSSFESWASPHKPIGWVGVKTNIFTVTDSTGVTMATDGQFGTNAVVLTNALTSNKRFTSTAQSISPSTTYTIKFWAKGSGQILSGVYTGATDNQYLYGSAGTSTGITVDGTSFTEYTNTVDVNVTATDAEFILGIKKGTATNGTVEIDSIVIISGVTPPPTATTIYDIQYTTATSGDSPLKDQTITTGGIVYATSDYLKGYWIADNSGAFNGVFVLDSVTTVALGDSITLDAKVIEKFSKTELQFVSNVVVKSSGNTIHAATLLPTGSVSVEDYESVFVRVENATNVQNLTFGRFNVSDNSGNAMVDDLLFFYPLPAQNDLFSFIQGPVEYSYSEYKILPRDANDMQLSPFNAVSEINKNIIAVYPNEVSSVLMIANANGVDARIISIEGKEMNAMTITSNAYEVNVASYPAGVYFLQVNGQAIKFVKK